MTPIPSQTELTLRRTELDAPSEARLRPRQPLLLLLIERHYSLSAPYSSHEKSGGIGRTFLPNEDFGRELLPADLLPVEHLGEVVEGFLGSVVVL